IRSAIRDCGDRRNECGFQDPSVSRSGMAAGRGMAPHPIAPLVACSTGMGSRWRRPGAAALARSRSIGGYGVYAAGDSAPRATFFLLLPALAGSIAAGCRGADGGELRHL